MERLSLCISPCPNDTFAFDAIVNRRIDCGGFDLDVSYYDIEELNRGVLAGTPDISKISYSVYPRIAGRYAILDSGSALGRGNGQLLVRRRGFSGPLRRIASPGLNTTANALLMRYFPQTEEVVPMLFSEIVLIHEGRFVYGRRNLELVADLGKLWEKETSLPLPLGAIVIRRDLPVDVRRDFDALLRRSVLYAMEHPSVSRPYVREHAQELDDDVIDKHIALFVNDYTVSLGEEGREAVKRLTGFRPEP